MADLQETLQRLAQGFVAGDIMVPRERLVSAADEGDATKKLERYKEGCSMQGTGILSLQLGGGTTRKSGTSMAAPHVAGVVALMWDKADDNSGTLSPGAARTNLAASASRAGTAPLDSPVNGYSFDGVREGILSASGALGQVQ